MAVIFWIAFCGGTGDVETSTEASMRGFTLILWSIRIIRYDYIVADTGARF